MQHFAVHCDADKTRSYQYKILYLFVPSVRSWRRSASSCGARSVSAAAEAAEIADRAQHFATITEQDPHFCQVLIHEVGKDAQVNTIFDETLRVLGHAEFLEPIPNLLHRGHRQPRHGLTGFYDHGNREFNPISKG